ncbi:hypothetical protein GWK47_037378 [Chionoecetes opilio]|uniref:Uncharacterized protein n=1 Tax=Chionoecetes opilio TaxID=41210 RepID=A0A8J4YGE5_CHIOP|nr:hypothetical protein GWK47_037378 [Chionoecetes opilio]
MATPKRRHGSPADEEGFTLVQRKRPKQQAGPHTPAGPLPQWRIAADQETTQFEVVRWIEDELKVALRVDITREGDYLLSGATWATATTLQEIASGQPRGIVLVSKEITRRGVLLGYPTALALDSVLDHPSVIGGVRCHHNAGHVRHLPTRQVLLTLRGPVPASLDLGCWGRFKCRRPGPASAASKVVVRGLWRAVPTAAPGTMLGTAAALHDFEGSQDRDHHGRRLPDLPPRSRIPAPAPSQVKPAAWASQLRQETTRPSPYPEEASATTRLRSKPPPRTRTKRKRKRRKTRKEGEDPPSRPDQVMEVDAALPPMAPKPATGASLLAAHGQSPARRCELATQTLARTYTFQEADLVDVLVTYENLACQETAALDQKISHEPALSLVRRLLREEKPLPRTLPTARPLNRPHHFYDHVGRRSGYSSRTTNRPKTRIQMTTPCFLTKTGTLPIRRMSTVLVLVLVLGLRGSLGEHYEPW